MLLQEGTLSSLDEDICDTIPWPTTEHCRHPDYPNQPVTWRMLVTHRASLMENLQGIRVNGETVDATYGPDGFVADDGVPAFGNPTCPLDTVQEFYRAVFTGQVTSTVGGGNVNWYSEIDEAWIPNQEPGSTYTYSNFAMGYLVALVELKSGMTFSDYCNSKIFNPLGMSNTRWFREDLPDGTKQASPTDARSSSFQDIGHFCYIDYGSGQLYSTPSDLAKFLTAMMSDNGSSILWGSDVGSIATSCQEQDENGDAVGEEECSTGIAWQLLSNASKRDVVQENMWMEPLESMDWTGGFWHDGAEFGVDTLVMVLPASEIYLAVISNTETYDGGATTIAEAILVLQHASGGDNGFDDQVDDDSDDDFDGDDFVDDDSTDDRRNKGTRSGANHVTILVTMLLVPVLYIAFNH